MAGGEGLLAAGWEAARSGRLDEAERLGRAALAAEPAGHSHGESAEGWFLLGVACHGQGRPGEAAECYTRAVQLRPDLPEIHNNLGNALCDSGQTREAVDCFRHALRLRPDLPEAHNNLGNALRHGGQFAEAIECFLRALQLRPDFPEAHNNLGIALQDQGRPADAEVCFRQALRLRPDSPEVQCNLGNALRDLGQPDAAVECYRRALALRPNLPEACNNLGNALRDLRRLGEAQECYTQALQLRPKYPEAFNNLGSALQDLGRPAEAAECFRRALELRPGYPEAHNNLGITLRDLGRPGEALACYTCALRLRPDLPEAHNNLGITLRDLGQPDEAAECFRRALELRPNYAVAHDGLLLTLHYRAGVSPGELATAHADYQARHAAPLRACWRPHRNDRDPDRPLRLGFVSPDLGRHPVGYFLVRAAEALAHRPCEVVCYSDWIAPADDLTARFRAAASLWRDTAGLTDEKLADQIRADGIDILIDLAGHTAGNRLLAFARRPAPVQCTWLGYEGTTGLEAIDYLIADDRLVPSGAEAHHCERVLRLPGSYTSYDPAAYAPEPGPLPALRNGRVTFGCFNNPAKLSPPALAAFAAILRRVPAARLILKYRSLDDPMVGARLVAQFAAAGADPERLELHGESGHVDYLAAYRGVDVALDPFPFAGGVTTCDALWMGVPVATRPGATFASRHGLSHLTSIGLAELAAADTDEYVALAVGLARDLDRLAELRAGLRPRMARSPLCDGERLANGLLAALRSTWREWAAAVNT